MVAKPSVADALTTVGRNPQRFPVLGIHGCKSQDESDKKIKKFHEFTQY
jgi:hypothetical protein